MKSLLVALVLTVSVSAQERVVLSQRVLLAEPGQTSTQTIQANKPFDVLFDYAVSEAELQDVDGFRLYVNGTLIRSGPKATILSGTAGRFPGLTLARGSYTVTVTAYNTDFESDPATIGAVSQPGKPKTVANLRMQQGG